MHLKIACKGNVAIDSHSGFHVGLFSKHIPNKSILYLLSYPKFDASNHFMLMRWRSKLSLEYEKRIRTYECECEVK